MRITRLVLTDFRNYPEMVVEPAETLTVLTGRNGAGKTNIIEAIEVVATGRSFRTPQWTELIRWGATAATVKITASGEVPDTTVDLTISNEGSRSWRVRGETQRWVRAATSHIPAVTFTPEDLALVKGSAERRRATVDLLGDQLSATYAALRKEYTRVIRQRNVVLKEDGAERLLEPFNEQLAALGGRLYAHRSRLLGKVMTVAGPVYERLSGGESLTATICDRCGLPGEGAMCDTSAESVSDALRREIARRAREERARKVSLVGPHRDDIIFSIGGHSARAYASQGQQRTVALAWKWAEVDVITSVLGKTPVLLLDDVMSELDKARRAALTEMMSRDVQTFVTTTNMGYFADYPVASARVIDVGGA